MVKHMFCLEEKYKLSDDGIWYINVVEFNLEKVKKELNVDVEKEIEINEVKEKEVSNNNLNSNKDNIVCDTNTIKEQRYEVNFKKIKVYKINYEIEKGKKLITDDINLYLEYSMNKKKWIMKILFIEKHINI